jgi:PTH1 family peptidyl-tRNA hydrolase
LVVGLGNPGPKYENTPHNLGFLTIDRLALSNGIRVDRKDSKALLGVGAWSGKRLLLAQPH